MTFKLYGSGISCWSPTVGKDRSNNRIMESPPTPPALHRPTHCSASRSGLKTGLKITPRAEQLPQSQQSRARRILR